MLGQPAEEEGRRAVWCRLNVLTTMQDKRVSREEWQAEAAELQAKCPFGQVPVLFVGDDKCLAQTAAIGGLVGDCCTASTSRS